MSQTLNLVPRSCFLTSGLWTGSPWPSLRLCVRSLLARPFSIDLMSESGVSWRGENKYVVNVTTLVVILATTGHEQNN